MAYLTDYKVRSAKPQNSPYTLKYGSIEDNKTLIGDVKNHGLRFLNELKGHDVIALKSRQVASDVSKQVRRVRCEAGSVDQFLSLMLDPHCVSLRHLLPAIESITIVDPC